MSKTVTLPISSAAKILVGEGESITVKTILARSGETTGCEIIHVAKLLGVASEKISQYLKKKIGEKISAGDVIAEKKGILSSSVVKSPINGKLGELDLAKGTVNLIKYVKAEKDLISPVSGKIKNLTRSYLEIEVDNPIFKADKGEGREGIGKLQHIAGENLGTLDVDRDVEESIVLCKSVKEETLVKFSVLGAKGGIFLRIKEESVLPWVVVEESIFEKLIDFEGKKVWLRPKEKQIIVLE